MKPVLFIAVLLACFSWSNAQTGRVDAATGKYSFTGSLADNYMFYGYAEPNRHSKKLILFSRYPDNISDNNTYQYPLGAYHETTGLKDGEKIEYIGHKKGFAEMRFEDADHKTTVFYISQGYVIKP